MVQFASYLRRVLCKTRLIFPRLNGPNKYMKGWASESIRNACFNLERLSSSSRLARPGISAGVGLIQARSTRIRIRLKTQHFFSFSKKLASTRSVFARPHVYSESI